MIVSTGPSLHIDSELLFAAAQTSHAAESSLVAVEREHILWVLEQTGGVIEGPRGAARILDMHPNTLRSRMKRLGIGRTSP